jgi:hypothetical protein
MKRICVLAFAAAAAACVIASALQRYFQGVGPKKKGPQSSASKFLADTASGS